MGSEVHRKPELEMHLEQSPSSTSPFVDKEIGQLRGRKVEGVTRSHGEAEMKTDPSQGVLTHSVLFSKLAIEKK